MWEWLGKFTLMYACNRLGRHMITVVYVDIKWVHEAIIVHSYHKI